MRRASCRLSISNLVRRSSSSPNRNSHSFACASGQRHRSSVIASCIRLRPVCSGVFGACGAAGLPRHRHVMSIRHLACAHSLKGRQSAHASLSDAEPLRASLLRPSTIGESRRPLMPPMRSGSRALSRRTCSRIPRGRIASIPECATLMILRPSPPPPPMHTCESQKRAKQPCHLYRHVCVVSLRPCIEAAVRHDHKRGLKLLFASPLRRWPPTEPPYLPVALSRPTPVVGARWCSRRQAASPRRMRQAPKCVHRPELSVCMGIAP